MPRTAGGGRFGCWLTRYHVLASKNGPVLSSEPSHAG